MKSKLMTRIFLSTLVPVFVVFVILTTTLHQVVSLSDDTHMKDSVRFDTAQILAQIALKINTLQPLLSDISDGMATIRFDLPEAEVSAEALLRTLFSASSDVYCAWFAFEPGTIDQSQFHYRSLVQTEGEIVTGLALSQKMLDAPELSPWYHLPQTTGNPYFSMWGAYDYGIGRGDDYIFIMSYPILVGDEIVGCVGIDVLYENLIGIDASGNRASTSEKRLLLSKSGEILFSDEPSEIGTSLFDRTFKDSAAMERAIRRNEIWLDEVDSPFYDTRSVSVLYPFKVLDTYDMVYFMYRDAPSFVRYSVFLPAMIIVYVTVLLGFALLVLIIYSSTRGIVRPIRQITDSFHQVASSGSDVMFSDKRIPITPTNISELEILQTSLATMMFHLREIHDLKLESFESRIEKEKLIATADAKSNFFATMSHELRTPMNVIHGIAEIMLHEGGMTPQQEKHIIDVKTSSDALLDIINDIMDFSKMESGNNRLRIEHYDFKALVDDVAALVWHLAEEAELEFELKVDKDLPYCLVGDSARLRQILLNLLSNAVKYTRRGSVALNIYKVKDQLHFDVIDSGIGIKAGDLDNIFESFNRLDTRRNREVNGTGLGLSIAKSLALMMNGNIFVTSELGVGSTFSLVVPLVPGDEAKIPEERPTENVGFSADLKILIVDDNEVNLRVSSGLIKTLYGIDCDIAMSGEEAISKVQIVDYDIVFMDHMMPEMDGVDTTRYIRAMGGKYEQLPIVALTANAVIGTREELLNVGLDDFVSKPIQKARLQEVLYTWIPKSKHVKAAPPRSAPATFVLPSISLDSGAVQIDGGVYTSEALQNLHGNAFIDLDVGLENIGGDEEMYLQSLRLLDGSIPETVEYLSDVLARRQAHDFTVRIHRMKGSLASLGAKELAERAKEMELAAIDNDLDLCDERWPAFAAVLGELSEVLRAALADADDGTISGTLGESSFEDLHTALSTFDYEEIMNSLTALLSMKWGDGVEAVLAQVKFLVEHFEYVAASKLIENELL